MPGPPPWRPHRPWPLAAANRAWSALQALGLVRVPLDESSLLNAARRSSGLSDFGDESFLGAMRRLLDSLEGEARLHPLGRFTLRTTLVGHLVTRLRLAAARARHAEIAEQRVQAPVFITGLQRTGTTLLHRLLACDPALRPLLSWEALTPVPAPERLLASRGSHARDPRMRKAEWAERSLRYLAPRFFAIHPVEAHEPEEDVLLLDVSFVSPTADATLGLPGYSRWFAEVDQRPAYAEFRSLVQLLLWQRPGRWLGKTPHHLEQLDALLHVFPDARVIQTHRDPTRVVASFSSMILHGQGVFSDAVDPRQVGDQIVRKTLRAVERGMASRERLPAATILDVHSTQLVEDPLKEVRRVYEFLDQPLPAETEGRMRAWLAENRQHKHGVHRYALEDFGIERAALVRELAPYCERFGLGGD